jgi:hypothetical protein
MCEEKKNLNEELEGCGCGCDCGCDCGCEDEGCFIELTDEEGNTAEYAIIDVVELEDRSFAVLATEEDPENVVILEFIEGENEEGTFVTVDDEALLKKVFDAFVENYECGCDDDDCGCGCDCGCDCH